MNSNSGAEDCPVLRKNRMAELVEIHDMLDGLTTDFAFLREHVLAMVFRVAKQPQLMETVTRTA